MVNAIHTKWCSLVTCNNRGWGDRSRNEMNNTVAMCPPLLLTRVIVILSYTLIYLGDTESLSVTARTAPVTLLPML